MRGLLFLFLLLPSVMMAQTRKVGGEYYTYYADPTMSVKEALAAAIENARVESLAKEFGTLVSQNTYMGESAVNGRENSHFMQLSSLEVKGEWLEDLDEPISRIVDTTEEGIIVIKAKVYGKARALTNDAVDFTVRTLRNGIGRQFENTEFEDGDSFYLQFSAPSDGYVMVYLADEEQSVYRLLPYKNDNTGAYRVEHDFDYCFFSPEHARNEMADMVDEMLLRCNAADMELNRLYVVFSPNKFTKPEDRSVSEGLPQQLSFRDFSRWLGKCRVRDNQMGLKIINIKIKER